MYARLARALLEACNSTCSRVDPCLAPSHVAIRLSISACMQQQQSKTSRRRGESQRISRRARPAGRPPGNRKDAPLHHAPHSPPPAGQPWPDPAAHPVRVVCVSSPWSRITRRIPRRVNARRPAAQSPPRGHTRARASRGGHRSPPRDTAGPARAPPRRKDVAGYGRPGRQTRFFNNINQ
jgi:hypothetical protein